MSVYPRVFKVRQLFDVAQVDDVAAAVDSSLSALDLGAKIQAGIRSRFRPAAVALPTSILRLGRL